MNTYKFIIRLVQLQNYHFFGNATGYIILFYKKDGKLHKKEVNGTVGVQKASRCPVVWTPAFKNKNIIQVFFYGNESRLLKHSVNNERPYQRIELLHCRNLYTLGR